VGFNDDFKIMFIEIPDAIKVTTIKVSDLPAGWRNTRDYSKCQMAGDIWFDANKTLVLKVPSAVLPESSNFVINTTHADYKKIHLVDTTELVPDERIEEILKKYR
jgi:RES domain-containing protein